MRLIQLYHPEKGRRIAAVDGSSLLLINKEYGSCYPLFEEIIKNDHSANSYVKEVTTSEHLNYDDVYAGNSLWRILPAFDHPYSPLACILSGTGLTHKASAENRQKMHEKMSENESVTDSMEMYLWGEEGGKPKPDKIGVQPEWFFKGNGTALRGFNDPLVVPPYANDGGEEPEIAGLYYVDTEGTPCRVGFAVANEFSDHVMEKKNYLYLAPSKLRTPAIGPELILDSNFQDIPGRVAIERDGEQIWSKGIKSGEQNMSHSLQNLEYHHFKYDQHRIPGTVHIHFFGADAFSFGENIELQNEDVMTVEFKGFGRPLRNPLKIVTDEEKLVKVRTLD